MKVFKHFQLISINNEIFNVPLPIFLFNNLKNRMLAFYISNDITSAVQKKIIYIQKYSSAIFL